jgi:putative acetyltransferase
MTDYTVTTFTIESYEAVFALWAKSNGIGLSRADDLNNIALYLDRNPGMRFIAKKGDGGGAILAGHDGRRGYIHHLAVDQTHRRKGIARELVRGSTAALGDHGIRKCHLFICKDNPDGLRFWSAIGWRYRSELGVLSKEIRLPL